MAHVLPSGLYRIQPGYFYDATHERLLSLKSGELKPLKYGMIYSLRYGRGLHPLGMGWTISVRGRRRVVIKEQLVADIKRGRYPTDSVIPIHDGDQS